MGGFNIRDRKSGLAYWSLSAALAVTLGIGSFSQALAQESDPDATINIGSLYEPQNLDNTAGAGQGINEAFNGNVYEALFRLADDGKVEPVLSKDFSVSDDGLTYTFKLQPGVTFHSGAPLTSKDVKFSIERVAAPESKSSRKSSLKTISAVETPDDETVVVKLSSRSISLPYNLSYVWVVNDEAKDLQSKEDGTGPYELEDWRRGSSLSMKRFDKYWGAKPKNGEVVFQYFTDASALNNALLTGSVDIITSVQIPDSLAQFKDNPDFTVSEGQSTTKLLLAYNDRIAPFDNVKVRKALARAIDDQKLLKAVWGDYGTLIGSFVPRTDPWYVDLTKVDAYDPESAKELLKEAGYPDGFTFTIDTPNYDPHPIAAQFIQSELAKVGVTVKINVITANEWYTKVYKAHDFQATLQEHVNHRDIVFYGNPDFYWGYNNPKVVELIKEAEASATTDEQTAKLTEANKIIAEDAASNWFYLYPQIVVSKKSVSGYPINGLNSQFSAYDIVKAE
ncbi:MULTISPECIES: ABC transporter substrate-binding protein [Brucella]|jgi:peptide/nickel transport system substrate-binding protein|uniref:ABC transporter substrate-binding protein n=1 Tax=Brucella TaxID=234 RepID=UPI0005BCAE7D|nr:ABC transporter substrate-binding protein [Brucella anthropi]KIU69294.1 ABC transporter substrate-binding protein [Brucella anthropi]MBA8862206.1 peptide/nickel transport system substrate-binding protein [Brucella anthropi]MDG9792863.1 ABC transporter substrate-binding protein [Brucella anthropi]MDH0581909.1 ABC transporter substrate-binding protein [Brucella anthropi]MDH0819528.1 ABC transporter substrate-binding protein [Brucella anthropi]